MANSFQNTQLILDDFLIHFQNNTQFALTAGRNFTEDYKNKPLRKGDTLKYRLPYQLDVGTSLTVTPQDITDRVREITVDQIRNVALQFNGLEITLEDALKNPFAKEYMETEVERIANSVELHIAQNFYKSTYNAVGTPGTAVTASTIGDVRVKAMKQAIPMNNFFYGAMAPDAANQLGNSVNNYFNTKVNTAALEKNFLGELKGVQFFESVHLGTHTAGVGAGGSATAGKKSGGLVNGAVSSGSTINIDGLSASEVVFTEGDVIEVAGVYSVNPLTLESTGDLMQFVVTADITSNGSGQAAVTVSPAIVTTGAGKNVSAALADNAAVSLYDTHKVSLIYNREALYYAAPQLQPLEAGVIAGSSYSDKYRMALTYTKGSSILTYQAIERLDHLFGVAFNPEFAIRLMS
jgi:hypothetical protein